MHRTKESPLIDVGDGHYARVACHACAILDTFFPNRYSRSRCPTAYKGFHSAFLALVLRVSVLALLFNAS